MTITSSSTFSVANAATASSSGTVSILPPVGSGTGKGRLIHPSLGTLDYYKQPDHVTNMDGDVIFGPVWAHSNTIGGGVDALWAGNMRDVVCRERWTDRDLVYLPHVQSLAYFWMNPPDPTQNLFVQWLPNYRNGHVYNVALVGLTVGGSEYTYDTILAYQAYVEVPLELQLRIISKVS